MPDPRTAASDGGEPEAGAGSTVLLFRGMAWFGLYSLLVLLPLAFAHGVDPVATPRGFWTEAATGQTGSQGACSQCMHGTGWKPAFTASGVPES